MDRTFSRHFQHVIGFALLMLSITLTGGIIGMILLRPVQNTIPFESFSLLSNSMFLAIFHGIIFGSLLPLGLAFVGWTIRDHLAAKRVLWLSRSFRVYATGAVFTVLVHIYQDVAMAISLMKGLAGSLATADANLFMGRALLRTLLYSGSHAVLAAGAFWYAMVLWKSLIDVRTTVESLSAE